MSLPSINECCGCTACAAICPCDAISLRPDNEGFLQPFVSESLCVSCGKCEKACPVLNARPPRVPIGVYAAKSKDDEERLRSTSGGVFSLLARSVLQQGGVVFGVSWKVVGCEAAHIAVETLDGLATLRESKYVQSDMNGCYRQAKRFLAEGRKVLFSGCPCQIAGLKAFLGREYSNLFLQEVICNSVPSPRALREWTKGELEKLPGEELLSVHFRDKQRGWHSTTLKYRFATTTTDSLETCTYYKLWQRGFTVRRSCIECRFREFRSGADLTIGDFWGVEKVIPEIDDDKGISVVMVNTDKGLKLWEAVRRNTEYHDVAYTDVLKGNPCLYRSFPLLRTAGRSRDLFWEKINKGADIQNLGARFTRESLLKRIRHWVASAVRSFRRKLRINESSNLNLSQGE